MKSNLCASQELGTWSGVLLAPFLPGGLHQATRTQFYHPLSGLTKECQQVIYLEMEFQSLLPAGTPSHQEIKLSGSPSPDFGGGNTLPHQGKTRKEKELSLKMLHCPQRGILSPQWL